jgi:HEAT repeat protein
MSPSKGGQRRAAGVRAAVVAGSLGLVAAMLALRASGDARAHDGSAAPANDAAHAVWVAGPADPLGRGEAAIGTLDDSTAVVAFLAAVRGVDPVVCDLAVRSVDQGWGWGGSETPASAAARDARVREILLAVTRDLRDASVVQPLRAGLSDSDQCVRRMSGPLLGRSNAPGAYAALLTALRASDIETREMAALGLGVADSASAVPALVAALGDESPRVRAMAAWSLGRIEDAAAVEPLARALRGDADAVVRRTAAWALGRID